MIRLTSVELKLSQRPKLLIKNWIVKLKNQTVDEKKNVQKLNQLEALNRWILKHLRCWRNNIMKGNKQENSHLTQVVID